MVFGGEMEDIYDAIYPYYIISKVMGFAAFPLHIQKTKFLFFKHFILNTIYLFAIGFGTFGSLLYFRDHQEKYFSPVDSRITVITRSLLLTMVSVNYVIGLTMNFFLQRPIQNLFVKISKSDQFMKKLGIHMNYSLHRRVVILYLIETIIHAGLMILATENMLKKYGLSVSHYERFSTYFTTTITCTTFLGQMLLTLLCIYARLRLLNSYFTETFVNYEFPMITLNSKANGLSGASDTNPAELIRNIAVIHDRLNDIISQTNFCFSFQVR